MSVYDIFPENWKEILELKVKKINLNMNLNLKAMTDAF